LAGASPQTPLGELTALPRPPSWISEVLLLRGGREGKKGQGRKGRGEKGEKMVREWEGGGRGREEKGRQGPPMILSHPQFRFSRNMPEYTRGSWTSLQC